MRIKLSPYIKITLLILFIPITCSAGVTWTDQHSPIGDYNWADIQIADFNKDGVIDIVAANPDFGEQYSNASGLPVWLGAIYNYNNRWNWGIASRGIIDGMSVSMPYVVQGSKPDSYPHIHRIYNGNTGNKMAEWTIECVDRPGISYFVVESPVAGNNYTVEKFGNWPDIFHTTNLEFELKVKNDTPNFEISCKNRYGRMYPEIQLDTNWVSYRGDLGLLVKLVGSGSPDDDDKIHIFTHPARFEVTASFHGTEKTYLFDDDADYNKLEMGEDLYDGIGRLRAMISPAQLRLDGSSLIYNDVQVGEKWYFYTPQGPFTDKGYLGVDSADFDMDGQADIVGVGSAGIDVYRQEGPKVSDIGFSVGTHGIEDLPSFNPGQLTIHLNTEIHSPVQTEDWTITNINGTSEWNVVGEKSGVQEIFNSVAPEYWPGSWCGQFFNIEISEGPYGKNDQFSFSTYRVTWSDDVGPDYDEPLQEVAVGDINRDGTIDILAAKAMPGVGFQCFHNFFHDPNPNNKWVSGAVPAFSENITQFKLQDINRDGYLDIAAVNPQSGVHAWLGEPNGQWSDDFGPECETGFISCVVGDFNKDGFLDLAATSSDKSISIFYLRSDGTWFQKARASMPQKDNYNIGTGSVSAIKVNNTTTLTDLWTLTCKQIIPQENEFIFQVRGEKSGVQPDATVGEPYISSGNEIEFTIYSGNVDYQIGDFFTFYTGRGPISYRNYIDIDAGDLDNDGNLDLFAANDEFSGIRVWRGNGVYGWTEDTPPQESNSYSRVIAHQDINFDGNPDVIAASSTESGLQVWVGDGSDKHGFSYWENPIAIESGNFVKVAHGDFDLDGKLDITATNKDPQNRGVYVWKGDNLGGFTEEYGPTQNPGYYAVVTGDFNRDGRLDIAAGHNTDGGLDVWFAQPDWTWSSTKTNINFGTYRGLATGDMNRDGWLDIVAAKNYQPSSEAIVNGVVVLLNDGHGNFDKSNVVEADLAVFNFYDVDVADVDQDGWIDIIATKRDGNPGTWTFYNVGTESPTGSTISFPNALAYVDLSALDHHYGLGVTDFNLDSRPDFFAGGDGSQFEVGFGLGNRNPECGYAAYAADYSAAIRDVSIGDFNNDGLDDIGIASLGQGVIVFITSLGSNGQAYFNGSANPTDDGDYIGVDVADFDADGLPDILAASEASGASGVFLWLSHKELNLLKLKAQYPTPDGNFFIQQDSSVFIEFDKAVDTATITYENIQLKKGVNIVPYSLQTYNNNLGIRIEPIVIERNVEYTVYMRGGSEGLRSSQGDQFDGNNDNVAQESPTDDVTFKFTTIDVTPPSVPGGLYAKPVDHGLILTWAANSDPNLDSDLDGYWLSYGIGAIPDFDYPEQFHEIFYTKDQLSAPPTITVRGLDNDIPHFISIVAQDTSGNISPYSEWLEATPISLSPEIWWAGMYNTNLSYSGGGTLTFLAYVIDRQGDLDRVEIFYGGDGTQTYLYDDGMHGDFNYGDGLYALTVPLRPGDLPTGQYLLELVAYDKAENRSCMWPYIHIMDNKPGESVETSYDEYFRSKNYEFFMQTSIPFDSIGSSASQRPQVWAAGYQNHAAESYEFGPKHALTAIVVDPDGAKDITKVEVKIGGQAIGWEFVDDGTAEDFGENDSLFGIMIDLPGKYNSPEEGAYLPAGPLLLEIQAYDRSGNASDLWPYIVSN